jgi:hypothetical protein
MMCPKCGEALDTLKPYAPARAVSVLDSPAADVSQQSAGQRGQAAPPSRGKLIDRTDLDAFIEHQKGGRASDIQCSAPTIQATTTGRRRATVPE